MAQKFSRLTRPKIRALEPGEKATERGITAERLKGGDLRYTVNVMVDGQRIHRVIGKESEGVTRRQCEMFIEDKRSDARAGRLNLPSGRKVALGFTKAAQQYLDKMEATGGSNIATKRRQINMYLAPFFKEQPLDAITTFTVDRYKKRRSDTEAANGTINRELSTLSHILNSAIEWKWIKSRQCKIKMLAEESGRRIALTDDECDALINAAISDQDTYCWLFVMFGLNTAMRHGEILGVRFDQIDFDRLRLLIPDAKAGEREQPITPELSETLLKEREMRDDPNGWVFPALRKSKRPYRTRMTEPFRRAVVAAGLDPALVTPHVMRHTAITNLVEAGSDLATIQRISGHKTLSMVMRYTHVHGNHIDRAITAIGRTAPERSQNIITQELHIVGKKPV